MKSALKVLGLIILIGVAVLLGAYYLFEFCEGWYMTGQCN